MTVSSQFLKYYLSMIFSKFVCFYNFFTHKHNNRVGSFLYHVHFLMKWKRDMDTKNTIPIRSILVIRIYILICYIFVPTCVLKTMHNRSWLFWIRFSVFFGVEKVKFPQIQFIFALPWPRPYSMLITFWALYGLVRTRNLFLFSLIRCFSKLSQ